MMIRVMVVDDSPLVRKIATDILNGDSGIQVVATAATAEFALQKLEREQPDVITMDMEMPGMGGVEAIHWIRQRFPVPIIVLSAHAKGGAELSLQALEAGAVDFICKPDASLSGGLDAVARELVEKVKGASGIKLNNDGRKPESKSEGPGDSSPKNARSWSELRDAQRGGLAARYELVAIGTSTGGPVALNTVLSGLPESFPLPIMVVQHMPPVFTRAFAERLNGACALPVKEAEDSDLLLPGRVLIAPGDYHLVVSRHLAGCKARLNRREAVCGHRPSVNVLMNSVARQYGPRAIGVIMTGMGKDGAEGLRELNKRGGYVLAQDRDSSVIYGMNREVVENGDAHRVVAVQDIAGSLLELVSAGANG